MKETIKAAAVSWHGITFTGRCHAMAMLELMMEYEDATPDWVGFVTSEGRAVNRGEAAKIAGDPSGRLDCARFTL